jgi:hypothetical protein
VLGSYSSYDHYPFDPGKPEHTILTIAFDVFTYCHRSSRSCNTPTVDSLPEDCKLSACGRQPVVPFSFYCHFIFLTAINLLMFVLVRKDFY